MVRRLCVTLMCVAFIGSIAAAPVAEDNEVDSPVPSSAVTEALLTSTTESVAQLLAKVYSPISDKPGRIQFAGGVHQFRISNDEDEKERLIKEYNYHFVRVEQNLPHTTLRTDKFRAPSKN